VAGEFTQRQVARLLEQASEAIERLDWQDARARAQAVLALDPGNDDAAQIIAAADRAQAPSRPWQPPAGPLIGETIANGRYIIRAFLGEGDHGQMYEAEDVRIRRRVAVRFVRREYLNEEGRARVEHELRVLGELNGHPNILSVLDFGEENGVPFTVSRLMEGGDADSLRRQMVVLPLEQALRIGVDIARALGHAHARGFVHRNVKPANIWLDGRGTALLDDFSVSVPMAGGQSNQDRTIGTPGYMAPEALRGEPVTPQSDLYSLGCTLFELLCGRPPFPEQDTALGTAIQHLQLAPPRLLELRPDLPPVLEELIAGLLAKDPAARPPSASAVEQALLEVIEQRDRFANYNPSEDRPWEQPVGAVPPPASQAPEPYVQSPAYQQAPAPAPPMAPPPGASAGGGGMPESMTPPSPRRQQDRAPGGLGRAVERIKGWLGGRGREGASDAPSYKPAAGDRVHFSVTAPLQSAVGEWFVICLWAHLEKQRAQMQAAAAQFHQRAFAEATKGPVAVRRGVTLHVHLEGDELLIDEPDDAFVWDGSLASATFRVAVPPGSAPGRRACKASIYAEGVRIARIDFEVHAGANTAPAGPLPAVTQSYRSAFASYATADRPAVAARLQGVRTAAPDLEVFMDVLSLRAGQNWEEEIRRRIPASEVFYLFWSENAARSEWVEREWRLALAAKGADFIDPIPLVSPALAPPPAELAHLHFNDALLAFLPAEGPGSR
jgi:serine/threonine-protein kinase